MATFTMTTVDGEKFFIDGDTAVDIFRMVDGLRLSGKSWLECYTADRQLKKSEPAYVNIHYIVSIQT